MSAESSAAIVAALGKRDQTRPRPWPPPDSEGQVIARAADTKVWGAAMLSNPRPGTPVEWEWVDTTGDNYAPVRDENPADLWMPWPDAT